MGSSHSDEMPPLRTVNISSSACSAVRGLIGWRAIWSAFCFNSECFRRMWRTRTWPDLPRKNGEGCCKVHTTECRQCCIALREHC